MTEPIKLPPLPLEDALKRAYYYTEAGEWRYPETCNEWDRWHAVAKVATLAVEQATADLRAELARVTESARTTIKQMRDEGMRAEAECDKLRAEVDALKRRLGQHDSCNGVMSESGYVPECAHLRAEVERLRADLLGAKVVAEQRRIDAAKAEAEVERLREMAGKWESLFQAQARLSEIAQKRADKLRAEVERLRAATRAWEAEAFRRQKEVERLRAVISNAAHKLEQQRVWGGMDWTYPLMHPRVWRAVLEQLDAALKEPTP